MSLSKQVRFYRERRKRGICMDCPNPSPNRVRCDACYAKWKVVYDRRLQTAPASFRKRRAQHMRGTYRELKRLGLCTKCKQPSERSKCRACLDKQKARYRARRLAGVCTDCGEPTDRARCSDCYQRAKERTVQE